MQPNQPYEHRQDTVPEDGDSLGDILAALDDLIAEIESAPCGTEALDARIHFGFRVMVGNSHDHASLLISEGISWPTVKAVLDDIIPPFTTSLDASLDGERIVFVIRSAKRRRWGAMQRASSGEESLAWAQTEPLARRLAFLMSWRTDLVAAIKKAEEKQETGSVPGHPDQAPPEPEATAETHTATPEEDTGTGDREDKDWEVLF